MSEAKRKHKEDMISGRLQKSGDKLIHTSNANEKLYKEFTKRLEEGQVVDFFMESNTGTGTLTQLAKVHVCARMIANEMGETFDQSKTLIKYKAGLCIVQNMEGKDFIHCKTFAECSTEDLSLAIKAAIEIGAQLNMDLTFV